MKKIFLGLIILISFNGCGVNFHQSSNLKSEIKINEEYVKFLKVGDVQIVDVGEVKTKLSFKKKLAAALKRYPRINEKYLTDVWLVSRISSKGSKDVILGKYNGWRKEITLSINGYRDIEIIDTFYHELGHAINLDMTIKEHDAWYTLFLKRLKDLGYEKPLGSKWKFVRSIRGFPSRYSMVSFWEYFAEHFRLNSVDQEYHKKHFKAEHKLLIEHKFMPIKKIKIKKNEKTKLKKNYCRAA